MALDAISTPTLADEPNGGTPGIINGYDTDASTAIEILAAPGTGYTTYILEAILGSDDADAHPHLQDEDDNVLFGPLFSTVEGPILHKPSNGKAIKMVSNKALEIKAAAAGNVFVYVEYKVVRDPH
jgi:hypothetical protein